VGGRVTMIKVFICPKCGKAVKTTLWQRINHPHLFGKKLYLKCPECKQKGWFIKV
jgi:uncharacterized protein YlaI